MKQRLELTGRTVVNGFTGSSIWHLLYSFPPVGPRQIDEGYRDFAARYGLTRLALHAWCLEVAGARVVCPLPPDLEAPLERLFSPETLRRARLGPWG